MYDCLNPEKDQKPLSEADSTRKNSDHISTDYSADEPSHLPYLLQLRPSKEFKYESGKNKLLQLKLSEERENAIRFIVPEDDVFAGIDSCEERERQRFIELCGRLDMSCQITVRGITICKQGTYC